MWIHRFSLQRFAKNSSKECSKLENINKIFRTNEISFLQDILGNDDHFLVLGFPCNQFGQQEPDDEAAIDEFVKTNYNVEFPMFSKIDVKGPSTHPVWQFLTSKKRAISSFLHDSTIFPFSNYRGVRNISRMEFLQIFGKS